jgi:hypothetical protein
MYSFILKRKHMPGNNRSIGGQGLEQGGPNLGNDYSRNITREQEADDNNTPVIPHHEQPGGHKAKKDNNKNSSNGSDIKDDEDLPNYQQQP